MNAEWKTQEQRRRLAPGDEVLRRVCARISTEHDVQIGFKKETDSVLIAAAMEPTEIPEEVQDLVSRISTLRNHES